jgi:hypothetical protein
VNSGANEIPRENALPSKLGYDSNRQPVARVRTDVAVERIHFLAVEIGADARQQGVELRGVDGFVRAAPVNVVLAARLAHEELIVGRTARMPTGVDNELAVEPETPFAAA